MPSVTDTLSSLWGRKPATDPVFRPQIQPPRPSLRSFGLGRDQLLLSQRARTFDIEGLAPGQTYKVTGTIKGRSFKGDAVVNAYDGDTVDLTINASVMLMKVKVHGRLETRPDGSVHALAEQLSGPSIPGAPDKAETDLKVVSAAPNSTVLQAADGSRAAVRATAGGPIVIDFLDSHIELRR